MIIAEGVMKFLLKELEMSESLLAKKLLNSLKARLDDRRDSAFNSLILNFGNPNIFTEDYPIPLSTKSAAEKLGVKLMYRLFGNNA